MNETKAAIPERTLSFLRNILYQYMEDYGYKYIHKLHHFIVTRSSGNNRSMDMKPNRVTTLIFCQYFIVNISENIKSPILELEIECAFPSVIYRSEKGIYNNFSKEILKTLPLLLKNLQRIQSKTNKKKLYVGNSTRRN